MGAKVEHESLMVALAAAQGEFKQVRKDKTAKIPTKSGGQYSYKYADFADVLQMAIPILSRNGLAFTQPMRWRDGKLFVTSEIHFKTEKLVSDGIPINYDIMTPQELGSCVTYWRRYDGCDLLGIQADKDDDAELAQTEHKERAKEAVVVRKAEGFTDERIAPFQAKGFMDTAKAAGKTEGQIVAYLAILGLKQVEQIKKTQFNDCIKWAAAPIPVPADLTEKLKESVPEVSQTDFKKLFAVARSRNVSDDDLHTYIKDAFAKESLKALTRDEFDQLGTWVSEQTA